MITYPLNNIDYTAEDAELYFSTRESGVYDGGDFEVTVSGNDNDVTIGTGIAWIRNTKFSGKVVALKEPKALALSLPNSVYDRIDAIVIQFDANNNATDIIVKEGIASSSPVAPAVVRTESLYELHIFHVQRKAGATVIGVDNLVDLRNNSDYCGIMFDPISSIDQSLSKSGFAADAFTVGKQLKDKAPSGFGYGDEMLWLGFDKSSWSATGKFQEDLSAAFSAMPQGTCKQVQFVDTNLNTQKFTGTIWKYTNDYGFLTATNYSGLKAIKTYYGGTWGAWEWDNPPFVSDVEYRTTKRINDNAVYERMTSAGVYEFRIDGETAWYKNIAFDLLWENASRTSDFAAQTVSLKSSYYNFFAIEVAYNEKALNGSNLCFVGLRPRSDGVDTVATLVAHLITSGGAYNTVRRKITVNYNRTKITVDSGQNADGSENNSNAIPLKIYGIRGI